MILLHRATSGMSARSSASPRSAEGSGCLGHARGPWPGKGAPVRHLRSIIDNIAEYYRQHPLADRGVGVLVVDSLYADNDEGCSTVSAARMGKLLSCDERSVRRCRERLYEEALVNREKARGSAIDTGRSSTAFFSARTSTRPTG